MGPKGSASLRENKAVSFGSDTEGILAQRRKGAKDGKNDRDIQSLSRRRRRCLWHPERLCVATPVISAGTGGGLLGRRAREMALVLTDQLHCVALRPHGQPEEHAMSERVMGNDATYSSARPVCPRTGFRRIVRTGPCREGRDAGRRKLAMDKRVAGRDTTCSSARGVRTCAGFDASCVLVCCAACRSAAGRTLRNCPPEIRSTIIRTVPCFAWGNQRQEQEVMVWLREG